MTIDYHCESIKIIVNTIIEVIIMKVKKYHIYVYMLIILDENAKLIY